MNTTERASLIARYSAGTALFRAALARVPKEAMTFRPAPGKWSVHEIVGHCADSETNAYARIRYVVAEKEPFIVGYDQDLWAQVFDYHQQSVELSLAVIDAVRAATAALIRRLPESAWSKVGRHTESGTYAAANWLKIYAEHLEQHAAQIDRNLAAWKARPGPVTA